MKKRQQSELNQFLIAHILFSALSFKPWADKGVNV